MGLLQHYRDNGYLQFPADERMGPWASHARIAAAAAARDPGLAHWLRCGGTWFVGVDALPNDRSGRLADGPPLAGAAIDFLLDELDIALPLHRAQLSICYPGYPKPSPEESAAAFSFRRNRDAAHVDGLHAVGPDRRRHLQEPHAYILGISLTAQSEDASPLTVWPGSHHIMRAAFEAVYAAHPPERWPEIDVTDPYQEARRSVFENCPRLTLPTKAGDAVLLNRHLLHGVAPWAEGAVAEPDGRIVAYFRPEFPSVGEWLDRPAGPAQ